MNALTAIRSDPNLEQYLARLEARLSEAVDSHPGVLADPLTNRGDRRHFMRVHVDSTATVSAVGLQASHAVGPLGKANGLVDVPPDTTLPEGATVTVLHWCR